MLARTILAALALPSLAWGTIAVIVVLPPLLPEIQPFTFAAVQVMMMLLSIAGMAAIALWAHGSDDPTLNKKFFAVFLLKVLAAVMVGLLLPEMMFTLSEVDIAYSGTPLSVIFYVAALIPVAMIAATFYFFLTPGSVAAMFPNLERWLRKEFRGERTT